MLIDDAQIVTKYNIYMSYSEDEDKYLNCTLCKNEFCANEDDYGVQVISMNEWLDLEPKCDKCSAIVCSECLVTCYDCFNEGENSKALCSACNKIGSCERVFTEINCKYHVWYSCGKHDGVCAQCGANANYDARHQVF